MALTISSLQKGSSGDKRRHTFVVAFDSSYATGGESLTPADVGLHTFQSIDFTPTNGYYFEFDYTNNKVKVFQAQSLGVIQVNTTSAATVGTSKETLATYSLPASTLAVNGQGLRLKTWGITAANANNKTLGIDFGASTVASTGAVAGNNSVALVEAVVVRTGSNTQEGIGWGQEATTVALTRTAPTETDTGAITINVFGTTPTAAGDLTFKGLLIEKFAAPGTGTAGVEVPNAASLAGLTGVRVVAIGT